MQKFIDLLRVFALKQHVQDFTHIDGHILDLVICSETDSLITENVKVQSLISDHFLIVCSLNIENQKAIQKRVKCRKIKDIDVDSFRRDILNSKLNKQSTFDASLDEIVEEYNATLQSLLDKHAPETIKTLKPRPKQPWYTTDLRSLRRISRRKERNMQKTSRNHPEYAKLKAEFKTAKNTYFQELDTSKTSYYSGLVISNKKDQGKLYKILNSLMNKKKDNPIPPFGSMSDLANIFGQYFTEKSPKFVNHSPMTDVPLNMTTVICHVRSQASMSFR